MVTYLRKGEIFRLQMAHLVLKKFSRDMMDHLSFIFFLIMFRFFGVLMSYIHYRRSTDKAVKVLSAYIPSYLPSVENKSKKLTFDYLILCQILILPHSFLTTLHKSTKNSFSYNLTTHC